MNRAKAVALHLLCWLTNHLVCYLPSFTLRRAWYRMLGVQIGEGSGVHRGCYLAFYGPGQVRRTGAAIGSFTRVNRGCYIDARSTVSIGDNVSISPEVAIITSQHDWRAAGFGLQSRPVLIEDHVFIGMRAIVLPGSVLRTGAVVGAGSVVHGEVPAGAVVAGVPARVIGSRPEPALDYVLDSPFPLFE